MLTTNNFLVLRYSEATTTAETAEKTECFKRITEELKNVWHGMPRDPLILFCADIKSLLYAELNYDMTIIF